jgi:ketosteroid isomerase-like protein
MPRSRKLPGTVEDIEAAFYDAIRRADIEALMALWADEEDIVCVHPGASRLVGHVAIRASWEAIFERGGVHIHPRQVQVTQNLMTSIHNIIEEIERADIQQQDLHVVATNIYVKTHQGWRMAVHHASVAPGAVHGEHAAGSLLH